MKTAISIPDREFERFERAAARHGMNRSEFYRLAAECLVRQLEGAPELTAAANAALRRAAQEDAAQEDAAQAEGSQTDTTMFVAESERLAEAVDW